MLIVASSIALDHQCSLDKIKKELCYKNLSNVALSSKSLCHIYAD